MTGLKKEVVQLDRTPQTFVPCSGFVVGAKDSYIRFEAFGQPLHINRTLLGANNLLLSLFHGKMRCQKRSRALIPERLKILHEVEEYT